MSDTLRETKAPREPAAGRPCDGGQLGCCHYMPCGDWCLWSHDNQNGRYDCAESAIGWRWYGDQGKWAPVCERHFFRGGLRDKFKRLDDELLASTILR